MFRALPGCAGGVVASTLWCVVKTNAVRWRQALVWVHVISSVGWMSQAFALMALMVVADTSDDPAVRVSALSMAHTLDVVLLAPMANAAAFTGFALSAATAWGYFRSWWVVAKFAITVVQLYLGIFVLSNALQRAEEAARAGAQMPAPLWQIVGAGMMASAIAFQAWLSLAKPGGRTPWAARQRPAKLPTAPTWVFVVATATPLADIAIGTVSGGPRPLLSMAVLVVLLVVRRRWLRRAAAPRVPAVA